MGFFLPAGAGSCRKWGRTLVISQSCSGLTSSYFSSDSGQAQVIHWFEFLTGRGFGRVFRDRGGNSNYWEGIPTRLLGELGTLPGSTDFRDDHNCIGSTPDHDEYFTKKQNIFSEGFSLQKREHGQTIFVTLSQTGLNSSSLKPSLHFLLGRVHFFNS